MFSPHENAFISNFFIFCHHHNDNYSTASYIKATDQSIKKHLKAALKDGYIPHKDDLFLIHGPGGVGKSSLVSMFLGKQRDLARVSTAIAEESINLCPVRDVSTSTFTGQWELVDIDRQVRMIAHTSQHLFEKEKDASPATNTEEGQMTSSLKSDDDKHIVKDTFEHYSDHEGRDQNPTAFLKSKKLLPRFASQLANKLSSLLKKSITKSLGDDPDNIDALLTGLQESLKDLMYEPKKFLDLMLYYSIRLLDSGGQPQFHEVVSIVLPAVTGIISVFKLSECLNVHGEVVFFKDGVQSNGPYMSYLTNEQVIRHNLLAIQATQSDSSTRDTNELPNIAFVGTFLDQQDACTEETPDQKDELLHSMITEILPEDLQQCIISNGESLKHVTFRLNARTPSDNDYETARKLKDALMSKSHAKPKNLPLKWFCFEVALHKLMEKLERQTLSLQDCEFVGYKLGFDLPSLKECLSYLRELHIISFYDFLPNVIFGSCQVILDKITELILYSLELKKGNCPLQGTDRKFYQQGILSLDILQSKTCSKHYNKHFTCDCLLGILQSLFIITEVGPGEYLMPCVLEVSQIYPSPPIIDSNIRSSFIIHFSKKSPMLGIYCCTISYLLTKAGWKLFSKGGEVVQVARNCVTFQMPQQLPGKLTFLDLLSSYLEVGVELPAIVAAEHSANLYHEIRETFVVAIRQAMQTLHYEARKPELSFLCPEQSFRCSILPHISIINTTGSFLTCSISPDAVVHPLTYDQKMWLDGEI